MEGMKRLRDDDDDDDVYSNSQSKRPFVPPPYGQSQQLTIDQEVSTYLKEVEDVFHDQTEKYDMFLDLIQDLEDQTLGTSAVIARVKQLFQGHDNLIFGFNTFLPKRCQITGIHDEDPPPKITMELDNAIRFINKIEERFQDDYHVFDSFLDILNMYRQYKDINEVYHEVAALFDDHPDLLDEFTRYWPRPCAAATAHHASLDRNNYHRHDDEGSSAMAALKQPQMDKCEVNWVMRKMGAVVVAMTRWTKWIRR